MTVDCVYTLQFSDGSALLLHDLNDIMLHLIPYRQA